MEPNGIERKYTVAAYQENFILFIKHYGRIWHGDAFKVQRTSRRFFNQSPLIEYQVFLNYEYVAWLRFEFETLLGEQLTVTVTMTPIIPVNPLSEAALNYLDDLEKAIQAKFDLPA